MTGLFFGVFREKLPNLGAGIDIHIPKGTRPVVATTNHLIKPHFIF